ncbi:MAG: hypothetical protein KGH64_04515 [Candidatus Micrarchaeota archaeon]|nr:hypothetical protein [Candidatus Micrarchaeota archaeon]
MGYIIKRKKDWSGSYWKYMCKGARQQLAWRGAEYIGEKGIVFENEEEARKRVNTLSALFKNYQFGVREL